MGRGPICDTSSFDLLQGKDYNITTQSGFLKALALVMRLKTKGLLTMAPVCSSFVFASSSVTRRNKDNFAGNEDVPCVEAVIPAVAAIELFSCFLVDSTPRLETSWPTWLSCSCAWLSPDRCQHSLRTQQVPELAHNWIQ